MSKKIKRKTRTIKEKNRIVDCYQAALSSHQRGDLSTAASSYKKVLSLNSSHTGALNGLAIVYQQEQRFPESIELLKKACKLKKDAAYLSNLGAAYKETGDFLNAEKTFTKALEIQPNHLESLYNLAWTFLQLENYPQAQASFKQVLELVPDLSGAQEGLFRALLSLREYDEALQLVEKRIHTEPIEPQWLVMKGLVLQKTERTAAAEKCYREALDIAPQLSEAHNNLGNIFASRGQYHDALRCYQKATDNKAEFIEAHINLAWTLMQHGMLNKALSCYEKLVQRIPLPSPIYSNYFFVLNYTPSINASELSKKTRDWGKNLQDSAPPPMQTKWKKAANQPLRIGFVSPDFREHPVGFFLLPLLENLDKEKTQVFCYAEMRPNDYDNQTRRIQAHTKVWRQTISKSDISVAQQIHEDRIDILLDLAGHSQHNRLSVFSFQPAPVQMSWLGYVNTTGVPAIQYRITDGHTDPPGVEGLYSEKLIRLPDSFFCFSPPNDSPPIQPPPSHKNGSITFGSFNNIAKITPEVRDTWIHILQQLPEARLLWISRSFSDPIICDIFREQFAEHGIIANRLQLLPSLPFQDFLEKLSDVDIALDSFPHNGHTITCFTLWMGVPVITLKGDRYASRMGATILSHLGLEKQIASSRKEYIEAAVNLANDDARLSELHRTLRSRFLSSPLCNAKQFAHYFQEALDDIAAQKATG